MVSPIVFPSYRGISPLGSRFESYLTLYGRFINLKLKKGKELREKTPFLSRYDRTILLALWAILLKKGKLKRVASPLSQGFKSPWLTSPCFTTNPCPFVE